MVLEVHRFNRSDRRPVPGAIDPQSGIKQLDGDELREGWAAGVKEIGGTGPSTGDELGDRAEQNRLDKRSIWGLDDRCSCERRARRTRVVVGIVFVPGMFGVVMVGSVIGRRTVVWVVSRVVMVGDFARVFALSDRRRTERQPRAKPGGAESDRPAVGNWSRHVAGRNQSPGRQAGADD